MPCVDWEDLLGSDLVCISTITSTATRAHRIADRARKAGVPVVLGGPHPSFTAEECLEHSDFVIRGEGEEGLPALVQALEKGCGFGDVPGLSHRGDCGEIVHNPMPDLLEDLDGLPDPDFDLVKGWRGRNNRIVPISTSRSRSVI